MGIMENVKKAMQGRSTKVAGAVDTAVDKVDQRTQGKYRDKLESGADKVKDTVTKLDPEADVPHTIDGPAARRSNPGQTDTAASPDRGPVTGTPPPTGGDAATGTGPDPVAPTTSRPGANPSTPTTGRPGAEHRDGTGPLQ